MTLFHKVDLLELISFTGHDPRAELVPLHLKTQIAPVSNTRQWEKPTNPVMLNNTITRTL
jgi:hypothetical protein